jgi:hypothetical protein
MRIVRELEALFRNTFGGDPRDIHAWPASI